MKEKAKPEDIFTLIKADHRTVEKLFSKLEKTSERTKQKRNKLYAELRAEITAHSKAEENAVYPRLKEDAKSEDIAFESIEEHGVVKYLLNKLDHTPADTKEWTGMITVLKEAIEHHVEEEEDEMFRKMRKVLSSEDRKTMAVEFVASKKSFVEKMTDVIAA